MSREMKFKAYHPVLECWDTFTIEDIYSIGLKAYAYKHWRQFTGRKDDDGHDLYEGDLVKWGSHDVFYTVQWGDTPFPGWYLFHGETGFNIPSTCIWVIGNIYDSPDHPQEAGSPKAPLPQEEGPGSVVDDEDEVKKTKEKNNIYNDLDTIDRIIEKEEQEK